jgi:ATP-dependent helicase/nuclease subunit A
MLTVYKASAGSGKTFRLVIEYLRLLMTDGNNYRHILAVTFTNKATAEMKERVVEQLSHLANGMDTAYRQILIEETGFSGNELTAKAGKVLEAILFDYNRFSVSTIDKFTQRVIKAFNREVGITPNFQIELDSELIINEAVDRLIADIGTNKALRKWLEDFIDEKIRNNKNFGIEKDLKSLGKELFKERLQENLPALQTFFNNPDSVKSYLDMLNSNIYNFESSIARQAKEIVEKYTGNGYTSDDFSGKSRGIGSYLEKIARGTFPSEISKTALAAAESDDKWVAKNHPDRSSLIALVNSHLIPLLNKLISFFNDNLTSCLTAKAIKNEWYTMAVLLDLNNQITLLNREKSVLPLANSNILLKSIIDGNDTPLFMKKQATPTIILCSMSFRIPRPCSGATSDR